MFVFKVGMLEREGRVEGGLHIFNVRVGGGGGVLTWVFGEDGCERVL